MELDDRPNEIREKYPLRQIRLDLCECGHDDADHQTEISIKGVEDAACCICVCKKFALPIKSD